MPMETTDNHQEKDDGARGPGCQGGRGQWGAPATLKVPTSVAGQKRRFERLSASSDVHRKADVLKATPEFA